MRNNKDVMVLRREGDRKLFLVALQMQNRVGALADLTGRLERGEFNVLSSFIAVPGDDGFGKFSFFVEAPSRGTKAEDLRKAIEKSKYVTEVRIKEAHNGLLVDSLNFPLSWNTGDRAIMLRTDFFAAMEEGMRKHFATGADVVLYEMGYHHGVPTWRNLVRGYDVRTQADLQELLWIYSASGWGVPEVMSLDLGAKTATVGFPENFECSNKKGRERPGSNFVRGHLNGLFENVMGTKVEVAETTCTAKGDPTCVFVITPARGSQE